MRSALADAAADLGHQARGNRTALLCRQALRNSAAEDRLALGLLGKPRDRLVDDLERQQVAILGVVCPGEQAMAFEHDALGGRIGLHEGFEVEAELEAGTAPGQPADLRAEDFLRQFLRILRGRNRDDRVRMHVIDMRERHETMQRRIDRGRARIEVEGAMRQEADHAVFVMHTLVDALQRFELLLIERRKAIELDRSDVTA